MATSRLANILQQEYKTKGLIGGAASAVSGRLREKLDIRNALFSGGGIGSIIGTKIFGKGYSATRKNDASASTSPDSLASGSSSILQDINTNGKITAKNSMALPSMAKQINIMQKNIAKLVTVSGGTPTKKADSFFSSSKFRENQYEAQFNKGTKPTKVEEKEKSDSGSGILSFIGSLVGGIASTVGKIISSVGSISGVFATLSAAVLGLGAVFGTILNFFIRSPIGRLLGLAGIALAATKSANAGTPGAPNQGGEPGTESNNSNLGQTAVNTAAGVGGALAAGSAVSAGSKLVTATKQTSSAILDARTTPSNISYKGATPTSKWGKFLAFLERKAPKLFAKFGARLAAAGALAAIPVLGWIAAAVQLGFSFWTAYEIYELWTEYSKEESKDSESKSPSQTTDVSGGFDANGNITGVTPASTTPTSSPIRGATSTSASTTPAKVDLPKGGSISSNEAIDYLVKKHGLTPAQAAGVVGNLVQESGLKSGAHNENSKENSYGLAQWNAKAGRLQKLAAYASSQGKDLGDPKMQLDYLMHELNTDSSLGGKELRGAQTAEEAANIFATKFERPQTVEPVRMKYAAQALAEYKPGTGGGSDSTMVAQYDANGSFTGDYGESTPSVTPTAPKISGPAVATASAAKESAAANKSAFSSADMADILSVIGGPKTSGSSSGSGMNQVVSTSKSTPYHSDFYSNLVRTQAL
jgi:hypothetical protein